jgi:Na+/H+ antiporter NhaD/arsenite permease-like protein
MSSAAIIAAFAVGYVAIVLEHPLRVSKAASALLAGVACWTLLILGADADETNAELVHHLGELSGILFFLLGAMTIVELIDAHDGFELITARITTRSRRKLLLTVTVWSFFLSAVLDNLTTSIVMMSLVRKLVSTEDDRMYLGGIVIIAANAGGVWSPIGDVTTTMLWVGGNLTTQAAVTQLVIPALVSIAVPVLWIAHKMKGEVVRRGLRPTGELPEVVVRGEAAEGSVTLAGDTPAVGLSLAQLGLRAKTGASVASLTRDGVKRRPEPTEPLREGDVLELSGTSGAVANGLAYLLSGQAPRLTTPTERKVVFIAGVAVLLFVPVFKTLTHLPPFMGILLGLGLLWLLTSLIHKKKTDEGKGALSVSSALQRVDAESVLFFLGILLAISALETAGLLAQLSQGMDRAIGNVDVITVSIGLSSAVVDNVPLVAAAQGMYSLSTFPTDHHFWVFLAYCAGTGGSILIIGSAAGIAVMGIQRITFGWYVRHMSLPALLGYAAGALTYLAIP